MSTVALRGVLAYDEKTKEWSWDGQWIFGDYVPVPVVTSSNKVDDKGSSAIITSGGDTVPVTASSRKSKKKAYKKQKDTSQPFLYKWQEAFEPSAIPVPSLNVKVIGADDENEEDDALSTSGMLEQSPPTRAILENKSKTAHQLELSFSHKITLGINSNGTSESQQALLQSGEVVKVNKTRNDNVGATEKIGTSMVTSGRTETKKITSPTPTPAALINNTLTTNDAKRIDNKNDANEKSQAVNSLIEDPMTGINVETKTTNIATAEEATVTKDNKEKHGEKEDKDTNLTPSSIRQQPNDVTDNIVGTGSVDNSKKKEAKKYSESTRKVPIPTVSTTMASELDNDGKWLKAKVTSPAKITYASIMPKFVEASDKFDKKKDKNIRCPSSGQWKGYFENVIPGKKSGRNKTHQPPQIQKVHETFYLFLNAIPSSPKELTTTGSNDNNTFNKNNGNGFSDFNKEIGKDDPESEPSLDLFAFETATKEHIPKIVIPKKSNVSIPVQATATIPSSYDGSGTNNIAATKEMISLVQVRGCGENEFGTFEIIGYLDLNTMVMEIQRQYVVTELPAASPPASSRRRRSLPNSDSIFEGPRPHSTRKRNPTWKRASYDPEEDRRRKRTRSLSVQQETEGSLVSIDPATSTNVAVDRNSNITNPTSSTPFATSSKQFQSASSGVSSGKVEIDPLSASTPMPTMSGGSISSSVKVGAAGRASKSRLVLPTQSKVTARSANISSLSVSGSRRRSSAGGNEGGLRTKRRSSTIGKSATGSVSTKSGSTYIRLPSVGDPKKARWRATHFLYYQRDDPEQRAQQQHQTQSGSNVNSSGNNGTTANATKVVSPKPKFVIYEGEMVDSKREGRGICLYTDGNLYEGEWKRNKEHGYGKLMSSDRKKIIYEGEWERGRMQGTGTYYYGSSDPLQSGSRYIGEFRENLRNGIGRYFLPDGSVYDGQWRDGVMNGHGVFTWPDKSLYDGLWKDGKRNGQGLLKKADGFVYDGQWVNNTMEGRGSAIYPNGQRYEGSFSNGRREGRGTIVFTNGAVYEGRFRDDAVDGQGTMKMSRTMIVPREDKSPSDDIVKKEIKGDDNGGTQVENRKEDFMIPISFQSDMTRILTKTGFM